MLRWVLIFLVVAIISGLIGFTSLAAAAVEIARVIFYIFVVLFVVTLVLYLMRRSK